MQKRHFVLLVLTVMLTTFAGIVSGQMLVIGGTFNLSGTVQELNRSGKWVGSPYASIEAVSFSTGKRYTTSADARGFFRSNIPGSGKYRVTARSRSNRQGWVDINYGLGWIYPSAGSGLIIKVR